MSAPETLEQIAARCEAHAREIASEIASWREDDDQGPVCIKLACVAEELLQEAATALRAAQASGIEIGKADAERQFTRMMGWTKGADVRSTR